MGDGFGFLRAVGLFVTLTVAALLALLAVQSVLGGGPDRFLLAAGVALLLSAVVGFGLASHLGDD